MHRYNEELLRAGCASARPCSPPTDVVRTTHKQLALQMLNELVHMSKGRCTESKVVYFAIIYCPISYAKLDALLWSEWTIT